MSGVQRAKTAISRVGLSRPFRAALDAGLIDDQMDLLDYGCGRGDDVKRLRRVGFRCTGWDPAYRNSVTPTEADVVNLGYVVNVIEDPIERREALERSWSLTRKLLIVSARLDYELERGNLTPYGDGFLTSRRTFQKFFSQAELREWIQGVLGVAAIAAGPGIFLVLRDENARLSFLASAFRRPSRQVSGQVSGELFKEHRELIEPLMAFYRERGRLPADGEVAALGGIRKALGSVRQAFLIVRRVTGVGEWDEISRERAEDFSVYLALQRFDGRPRFSELPEDLRHDVRAFFGSYRKACTEADELLFSAGNMGLVGRACKDAEVGKLTREALYVHESALARLQPVLRAYEGCARNYLGRVDGANIVKLNRIEPKVSYLSYPDFDKKPHPPLIGALTVGLRTLDVSYRDYSRSENPPILHRKEAFVAEGYPGREKFARLTRQEERQGLFENSRAIGWAANWARILDRQAVSLRGHRLVRKGRGTCSQ